jgi:hypothetical protein
MNRGGVELIYAATELLFDEPPQIPRFSYL